MTTKEKAISIFNKMQMDFIYFASKEISKKNALIAVDEIINTGALANRICGYTKLTKEHLQYW